MAQSYIDQETMERFKVFFKGEDRGDLGKQMADMEKRLKETATLEHEATGQTLEELREELRKKIKADLYGDKGA